MVKIKEYNVNRREGRGVTLSLPTMWCNDLNLVPGDKLEVYRDIDDRLIIVAKGHEKHRDDQAAGLREMMGGNA